MFCYFFIADDDASLGFILTFDLRGIIGNLWAVVCRYNREMLSHSGLMLRNTLILVYAPCDLFIWKLP